MTCRTRNGKYTMPKRNEPVRMQVLLKAVAAAVSRTRLVEQHESNVNNKPHEPHAEANAAWRMIGMWPSIFPPFFRSYAFSLFRVALPLPLVDVVPALPHSLPCPARDHACYTTTYQQTAARLRCQRECRYDWRSDHCHPHTNPSSGFR
jgi:hypothetical protein